MKYLLASLMLLLPALAHARTMEAQVVGMTCEGCATTVKASLENLPEVEYVAIDIKGGKAILTLKDANAAPDTAEVAEAIRKAGYKPGTIK